MRYVQFSLSCPRGKLVYVHARVLHIHVASAPTCRKATKVVGVSARGKELCIFILTEVTSRETTGALLG